MIKPCEIVIEFEYQRAIVSCKASKHGEIVFFSAQKAAKLFKYSLNPCSMRATRYAARGATYELKLKDWRYRSG